VIESLIITDEATVTRMHATPAIADDDARLPERPASLLGLVRERQPDLVLPIR
jgi:hypothetical protein